MQTIRSPNLVSRDAYDEVEGIGITQMEVIHGIDLDQFLTGTFLSRAAERYSGGDWSRLRSVLFRADADELRIQPGIAVYVMRMVLRGLEWLHKKGFIHGDVKPSNIMVDRLGTVKLIDYGRALSIDEPTPVLFGSPLYMAPEVHLRQAIVPQSDLYSVGIVGLAMMVGRRTLFEQLTSNDAILEHKLSLPNRLDRYLPGYVRENLKLVALLRRFLAADPKDRFPDAQTAESDAEGLRLVHRQLMFSGQDSDYGRETASFVNAIALDFWDTIAIQL
jgi:serine/threonine protein kinase